MHATPLVSSESVWSAVCLVCHLSGLPLGWKLGEGGAQAVVSLPPEPGPEQVSVGTHALSRRWGRMAGDFAMTFF